ncbi:hypothetical protein [Coleofasciculus sp. FACHB-1120]|uniref:hypothetical protein n=1 Tax=Coleofasciculus sp. FACHB-1120 TaxID=2692783 RepID=UPI001683C00E|nr:hypothetical protein [Coleofasciculus sp. FACHB-1120]MBD2745011.1 hypothetical protein [Coleofasciculus sp. FACHB-1120]
MPQVEKLKIFLASPSDVATERRHVGKVIEEINRTVAADKGIVLEVVSSENAFPSYGKDGQAILNEQIGKMQEYELFIGIMWNRIGTPTPRAKSGTAEEFGRAVTALRRKRKPQVWFYFREAPVHLTTIEDLRQREETLKFKAKFRGKGLFREYKTPTNFRDQLREHLTLWLNQYTSGTSKPLTAAKKQSKKIPKENTESSSSAIASARTKTTSINETSTRPRKTPASKSSTPRSTGSVKRSRDWVMLNEKFFRTKSSATQPDLSIILRLSPKDMEQVAELKSLHPGEFHNRKQIAYADQHDAGMMEVSSVLSESMAGKASFNIKLTPIQCSHNSGFAMEINYPNYTADEVAELRVRLLLLGEALPKDLGRFFPTTQTTGSYNHAEAVEKGIFPELWAKLQTQPRLFLPKAWLWAVYHLKMSQLVEDVLELELGPIKNKVMPVRFQGKRRRVYANREPSIIKVVGNCTLSA